jgi:hypothetical protein
MLLGVLLVADAVLYFVVIPAGITDPDGFGLDQGLPPSFSGRLAAILLALIMVARLVSLVLNPAVAEPVADSTGGPAMPDTPMEVTTRNLVGIAAALLFAFALVPALGFYLSSFVLVAGLMRIMGETHWPRLVWQPAIVVGLIWILFDRIFSIRLPAGSVFGG